MKVVKFGGTSLASADQIKKSADIVQSDNERRLIVVSAPGKRTRNDVKITDRLIACYQAAVREKSIEADFEPIRERFLEIAADLKVGSGLKELLDQAQDRIQSEKSYDYAVSRGEHFLARLIAEYIGFSFLDAEEIIRFDARGKLSSESYKLIDQAVSPDSQVVIPGFYGQDARGGIKAFSRGGSDISGAVIARGAGARVYENWTDVSGLLAADPGIVDDPAPIEEVSFRELRELSALGAKVFHEEAIQPVSTAGIPINIRNTNIPEAPGTMIVIKKRKSHPGITGVAGKMGVSVCRFQNAHLGDNLSLQLKILESLAAMGWKILYSACQCDTLLVILEPLENRNPGDGDIDTMKEDLHLSEVEKRSDLCIVGAVGENLGDEAALIPAVLTRMAEQSIAPVFASHRTSGTTFMTALEKEHYRKAIQVMASFADSLESVGRVRTVKQ